jgi:hypothetical protein
VDAVPVMEVAGQYEYLFAGRTVHLRLNRAGVKALQRDAFAVGAPVERYLLGRERDALGKSAWTRSLDIRVS